MGPHRFWVAMVYSYARSDWGLKGTDIATVHFPPN